MSVKLTLEFASEEEAIVALGKLVGLKARAPKNPESAAPAVNSATTASAHGETTPPAAADPVPEKRTRKPRADAGQPRGPNARTTGAPTETVQPVPAPADSVPPAAPTNTAAPVAPATIPAASPAVGPTAPQAGAAAPISDETVQKAVEKMFTAKDYDATAALLSRFGVKRGKDLPQDQRLNFINRVDGVVDRGEAI